MGKIIGYCRVSTRTQLDGNSLEQQSMEIRNRYNNAFIIEEQYSGAKEDRPKFNSVVAGLIAGDILVVTKLDRFCRTVTEGLRYVENLHRRGVIIHILNMGLVEDTPVGKMLLTNLFAFAEFERAMILERTQAGKAIARQKEGYREGRPLKFTKRQMDYATEMLRTHTMREVVDITRISESTLKRELRRRRGLPENFI
ncbi:recombinase family protein [Paenibacillus sp. 19GGS1-52]|uniref:recombinase family protein n=1 Tax=Paenibacillus sp. 19GGS1-52 TaxID=2758563 RepID=UPI001EFBC647|nr:recombinase family protein [Paenibacillus sp. 19GGS1-52]ULO06262.1 recombinase family protein [Paenibacillus sp. 19GGS1-52]